MPISRTRLIDFVQHFHCGTLETLNIVLISDSLLRKEMNERFKCAAQTSWNQKLKE
jgi:hypothetical protein